MLKYDCFHQQTEIEKDLKGIPAYGRNTVDDEEISNKKIFKAILYYDKYDTFMEL